MCAQVAGSWPAGVANWMRDVYGHVLPARDAEAATEIEAAIPGAPMATEPR